MPTEKPRITITMSNEQLGRIDEYRYSNKMKNQTQAILSLIEKGYEVLAQKQDFSSEYSEKAPSLSDEALEVARGYETLDQWGKVAVRELVDTEKKRCEDDEQFRLNMLMEVEPKVINLYTEPAAAGIATPTAGVDFQPYELKPGDPQDAAYAVYIQGDSMEPAFPDGSVVFINHDAIRNGDIGIFCVNGGTVCKQYYRDPMGGIVNLFSLNRKRADADVTIYPGSNETLICQGRVITKKKFPLPEGHM